MTIEKEKSQAELDEEKFKEIKLLHETGEDLTPEQAEWFKYKVLEKWDFAAKNLEFFKESEMDLRKLLVGVAGTPDIAKGIEYVPLENGYKLKIEKKITYGLVKDSSGKFLDFNKIESVLKEITEAGPDGANIASQIIKQKPELSTSLYNSIPDSYRAIAGKMVESKSGAPTIEIVEPKSKKANLNLSPV